ncbi:DUF3574 domain-containing protein [Phenylobacterium hankyongense]|uniref:DUF3574 domain-containing protein n=1 Tax=Phenylobacterium hankyongense TaxID=1813876 RepID=A0A328B2X7_9CAUL|nr:DUF3574 domain-containing protein [Phenylobacterium hankyongense]RAK61563.1 DUF3574 domain-containing protein [Phenylobacterium hankyongense]
MRILGGVLLAAGLALAGCATAPLPTCPAGQERLRTAQLFFGRNIGDKPGVSDAAFRKFVDDELTPRFPDGLTILDGGGQWRGPENQLIREASKVVLIVLPKTKDAGQRVDTVRAAYKTRFQQDAVLLITQASCVSF